MNRDIRFKFGKDINDGPLMRTDHKRPLSGRGLGHVTMQISKFWDPFITFERIELSA